jgi:hypothetical protein
VLACLLRDGIVGCQPAFEACAAREDMDKMHNYAQLFVELADVLMPTMVAQPGLNLGDLAPLDMLLTVVGYHDYTVREQFMNSNMCFCSYAHLHSTYGSVSVSCSTKTTSIQRMTYLYRLSNDLFLHCINMHDWTRTMYAATVPVHVA